METPKNLEGSEYSANVSAVVKFNDGSMKSLGTLNTTPYFRGRNLLLEYHNGSICLNPDGTPTGLRMSSLISLKCDHDLAQSHASISFLGSPDNCTFLFEARSLHACPSTNKEQSMAPVPIFLVFCIIAFLVYIIASMLLQPYKALSKSSQHDYSSEPKSSSSLLPLSHSSGSNNGGSGGGGNPLTSSNFVFPFPLSFLNPLLFRARRLRYTPGRTSTQTSDGSTITVFESLMSSSSSSTAAVAAVAGVPRRSSLDLTIDSNLGFVDGIMTPTTGSGSGTHTDSELNETLRTNNIRNSPTATYFRRSNQYLSNTNTNNNHNHHDLENEIEYSLLSKKLSEGNLIFGTNNNNTPTPTSSSSSPIVRSISSTIPSTSSSLNTNRIPSSSSLNKKVIGGGGVNNNSTRFQSQQQNQQQNHSSHSHSLSTGSIATTNNNNNVIIS